eukprot:501614_1
MYGRKYKKTPKSLKKNKNNKKNELEEIKESDDDGEDDEKKDVDTVTKGDGKNNNKKKLEPVNISLLLDNNDFFIFESSDIIQQLVELGTYIAVLSDDKKKQLKNTLNNLLDKCIKKNENNKEIFQMLILNMIKLTDISDIEYIG